jgi:5-methylcytosine-specific restriction endonuclease McrA
MTLNHLSDDALMASLHHLSLDARRLDARVVVHLVEVEERRLHLKAACSSLFEFCVRRLGMSEGASFRRINAARLARRFPGLVGAIESGAVHLSALVLLRDHLTESNVDELVAACSGKTKREVEELVARRAPRPDVPSQIRKLPAPVAVDPSPMAVRASLFGESPPALASVPAPAASLPPRPAARTEPLSESRYKVQLTVGTALRDKLERAKDLLRHRNPGGDLAVVMEHALDALLAKLEKERLGKTSRPRRTERTTERGRIPTAVRREVFARDGKQCTFVDEQGRRCGSRAFLELDHIESRALGGGEDAANLRVACRAHNRLHAEQVFGRKCVERGIHSRQRASERLARPLVSASDRTVASRGRPGASCGPRPP